MIPKRMVVTVCACIVAAMLWSSSASAQYRGGYHGHSHSSFAVSVGFGFGYPYYPFYHPFYPFYSFGFGWGYPFYGYPGYYGYPYPGYYGNYWASARLEMKPRNAQVYVDGYYVGLVDEFDGVFQRLDIPNGAHELTVYLPGYQTYRQKTLFRPGEGYNYKAVLQPLAAGAPQEPEPQPTARDPYSPPPPPDRYGRPDDPNRDPQAPEPGLYDAAAGPAARAASRGRRLRHARGPRAAGGRDRRHRRREVGQSRRGQPPERAARRGHSPDRSQEGRVQDLHVDGADPRRRDAVAEHQPARRSRMIADALILAAGAAVAYAWLCAVVAPIGIAITHLIDTRGGRRAWTILLLAAGGGALWTLIVGAFTMLATVLVPDAAIAVLLSPVTIPAMSFGVVVWSVETVATARVPRIGPAFELETALAPLSVVAGEAVVLAAEREYRRIPDRRSSLGSAPAGRRARGEWRDQACAA